MKLKKYVMQEEIDGGAGSNALRWQLFKLQV